MRTLGEETIPLTRERFFVGHIDSGDVWSYPEHTHRGFGEFFLLVRGRLTHLANGLRSEHGPGTLLLIREHDVHRLETTAHAHFNLNIPNADFLRAADYLDDGQALRTALEDPQPAVRQVPPAQMQELTDRLRCLALAMPALTGHRLYLPVLIELCQLFNAAPTAITESTAPTWMADALALCQGNMAEMTPARLALRLGISHEHLARTFRRQVGRSVSEHLTHIRIEHAAQELVYTEHSVLAIGLACGFESQGYFYRRFKEVYGVAPGDYRRSGRSLIPRLHS
jgi:AraC family transcriptional regulator, dual regulator of chb operon